MSKKQEQEPVKPRRSQAQVSENTARARKELALAELREMELAQLQGKLIPADEVRRQWLDVAGRITTALEALPASAAERVATARDARHAQTILADEVAKVRRQVGGEIASRA